MTNTWEFKVLENAVLYAGVLLKAGVDCVLIRTIKRIPQGEFFVVSAIGDLDGITPPDGYEKPQTTSTILPLSDDPIGLTYGDYL